MIIIIIIIILCLIWLFVLHKHIWAYDFQSIFLKFQMWLYISVWCGSPQICV